MELKDYQKEVLDELNAYFSYLEKYQDLRKAYQEFWEDRGISMSSMENKIIRPYDNSIKNVPNVTIKVPTAGGKTFIACNALRTIFDNMPEELTKVVTWFVPSDTILKQTYLNLSNPDHPYRQKIDSLFNSRVNVISKESALMGKGMSMNDLRENLTILVLSVDSFATNTGNDRKSYRENENLSEIIKQYYQSISKVKGADEYSLMNLIYHLRPVAIIDESHNFESNLRMDMLNSLHPRFILDLTATPRDKSNVISFVNAARLKKANMVKLPVIVYNLNSATEVLFSAVKLQENLEKKAVEEEKKGGKYIRPIVLLQAQPKSKDDSITFEQIKKKLLSWNIPENQIKIKTANVDEIKNINLMDRDCPVRFIITVNALKEGWDCPFAYILASLANKTSRIDVEQILGRILRQPYTKQHQTRLLNLSYVLTSSSYFLETVDNIVDGLNKAGFGKRDYRVASEKQMAAAIARPKEPSLFDEQADDLILENETVSFDDPVNQSTISDAVKDIEENAEAEGEKYEAAINENNDTSNIPDINTSTISECFASAKELVLPQFVMPVKYDNTFFQEDKEILVTKEALSEGFELDKQSRDISFVWTDIKGVQIDVDGSDSTPKHKELSADEINYFNQQISSLAPEHQKTQIAKYIAKQIRYDYIADNQITDYLLSIFKNYSDIHISDIIAHKEMAVEIVKDRIEEFLFEYRKERFNQRRKMQRIKCVPKYVFPTSMPVVKESHMAKGLYEREDGKINTFEYTVINKVANLPNVEWWHRNPTGKNGFCINGYINHYPDFIVKMNNGTIVIIETKGDDRDNSDSKNKLDLGLKWEADAGTGYKYFMVFEHNRIDDAVDVQELLEILKGMC